MSARTVDRARADDLAVVHTSTPRHRVCVGFGGTGVGRGPAAESGDTASRRVQNWQDAMCQRQDLNRDRAVWRVSNYDTSPNSLLLQ